MANMLQRTLTMSLPKVIRGDAPLIFRPSSAVDDDEQALVLFLYINFSVRERDIRGYIAMLMDLPSLESLKILIDDFIERAIGETGG
jgi:chemotaxis protein CheC